MKLHLSGSQGVRQSSERTGIDAGYQSGGVGVVQRVEHVGPQVEAYFLRDGERLAECEVNDK